VDLGANIGLVDRWLLNIWSEAEIIAVEPEPGNAETLRVNVSGLAVRVVEACVGATARTATLHTSSGEHGFTMVGDPAVGAVAFEVPVVTMETVLAGAAKIDLLKVDIEGAEEELFADCAGWIDKVELLLVECHGDYKLANLLAALEAAGAQFKMLEKEATPGWPYEVGLLERTR
jgi:FkbM family methyltransferase